MRQLLWLPLLLLALAGCAAPRSEGGSGGGLRVEGESFPLLARYLDRRAPPEAVPRYRALVRDGARVQLAFSEETGRFDQMRLQTRARGGEETWLMQAGTSVTMRDGMVVATRGLGEDVMSADASQTRALISARQDGRAVHFLSYPDGDHGIRRDVFTCEVRKLRFEELDLITRKLRALLFQETCYGERYGFLNLYWIDPADGQIWQSRQFVSPLSGIVAFRLATPETPITVPAALREDAE